jgi:hypothetical protein
MIITSSPNKDGLTAACGSAAEIGAREAGAEVVRINLNELNIGTCRACGNGWGPCLNNYECQVRDDFQKLHGEMAQMDASSFDWLGNGSYLHLHGAIDDATGRILALHFEKEETFEGYCELMFQMNQDGHLPREIYTDGRTVFAYNTKKKNKLTLEEELTGKIQRQPHFARALRETNILLIIAHSAQAKGGIENKNFGRAGGQGI